MLEKFASLSEIEAGIMQGIISKCKYSVDEKLISP